MGNVLKDLAPPCTNWSRIQVPEPLQHQAEEEIEG